MNQIVEIFSQYPEIVDKNGLRVIWVPIPELETNITNLAQSHPDAEEEFFVKLFVSNLRQHSDGLALKHLLAYLQRLGYRAARTVHEKWKRFQPYARLYSQHDLYQIAWLIAKEPAEFFRRFDLQRPPNQYAYRKMEGKIKDEIFVNIGMGARMYSDWGLLWRKSRSFLQEALNNQGYTRHLDRYLLARDCFKEIYASQRRTSNGPLPAPEDRQFQDMADLYNRLVQSTIVATPDTADRVTIEKWLRECIQVLRTSQTIPSPLYIDASSGGDKDSEPLPLSEMISDDSDSDSQWEQLEIQEPAKQLMAALPNFLPTKTKDTNKYLLLLMKCGLNLDSRSIAPIFGVYYTTLNHRYNSHTQQLLKKVAKWAQDQLGVTPDSETLQQMQTPLNQWLNQYYQDLVFRSVFENAWQQLDPQRRNLLHLQCFWKIDKSRIARKLHLPESEVSSGLEKGRRELAVAIASWIQKDFNLPPELVDQLVDKIAINVQVLIANYPINTFPSTEQ